MGPLASSAAEQGSARDRSVAAMSPASVTSQRQDRRAGARSLRRLSLERNSGANGIRVRCESDACPMRPPDLEVASAAQRQDDVS